MHRRVSGIVLAVVTFSVACLILNHRFPNSGWLGCLWLLGVALVLAFVVLMVRDVVVAADTAVRALVSAARHDDQSACPTCQACGYNLTGNTSGLCPECGTPLPA